MALEPQDSPEADVASNAQPKFKALPFPPLTKSHILNCSYQNWYKKYRALTPKARIIPLTAPFVDWLKADGIRLPFDEEPGEIPPPPAAQRRGSWSDLDTDSDSGIFTTSSNSNEDEDGDDAEANVDPALHWRPLHRQIKRTIDELGGKVVPKLNWSSPKDAVFMNATNSLDCTDSNDIYLLLKSSAFVTHDVEHAFDGCVADDDASLDIEYVLVLRKHFVWNPALEFRVFVRNRKIIGICQREAQYFAFLADSKEKYRTLISDFFEAKVRDSFPDDNFVLDLYIPPPHERVWLVDVNPWAARTDPLLFSWLELLTMPYYASTDNKTVSEGEEEDRVSEIRRDFEFRLVGRDDPEAYSSFASQPYSAHKLPKEVVDASQAGSGGLAEFAGRWKEIVERMESERREAGSDEA